MEERKGRRVSCASINFPSEFNSNLLPEKEKKGLASLFRRRSFKNSKSKEFEIVENENFSQPLAMNTKSFFRNQLLQQVLETNVKVKILILLESYLLEKNFHCSL